MPKRQQLDAVIERIRRDRNFDFRNYKRGALERRIARRMEERKARTPQEYLALLERKPEELDALVSSMLIKVTSFFRDPEAWDLLAREVLPELLARKAPGDEIRLWSVGCATGEETYSLAMIVLELLGDSVESHRVKVFGTDVDEAAIAAARRGVYGADRVRGVSKARLARFFTPTPEGWAVNKELRRLVVFGANNVVGDAPISRVDVLVCRNLFIYLDAPLQKRILSRFQYALRPGGVLFLGKAELIPVAAKLFEPIDLSRRLYRRGGASGAEALREAAPARGADDEIARAVRQSRVELTAMGEFHRDAMNALRVPVVLTSPDGTVVLWNPAAAELWGRSAAEVVGKKLTTLGLAGVPGDLLVDQTLAVRTGKAERLVAEGVMPARGGQPARVLQIEVARLGPPDGGALGLVYSVADVTVPRTLEDELRRAREERQRATEDLQTTNEELQSSNEELETTNEELQSANEELQTTNEELQSTNEELETTNEELQSTNAELDATNRELAQRTEELNVVTFHQRTIIRSLSAAVAVVDPSGRVTTWNLAAERIFGVTEAEAIGQVLWTLRIPVVTREAVRRIRKNLGQKLAYRVDDIAFDLTAGRKGHASLSVVPLVDGGRSLGAVLILEDTTRAVALAEERLRDEAEARSRGRGGPRVR